MTRSSEQLLAEKRGERSSPRRIAPASSTAFDVAVARGQFPILSTKAHGKPLVYLDNGATTQKPRAVIDRMKRYYESENANIHRGVYQLSQQATQEYEQARADIARFVNAAKVQEIIFTRGVTESINLVASSYVRAFLKPGDEIVLSQMEHHSNIVPWQLAADSVGAVIRVIPINDAGELRLDEFAKILQSGRVKFVSVVHLSNSLGTINDVKAIVRMAHEVGAKVLIDGAQWVAHFPTDVLDIGCDFYAFSGHKLFGPTGVGVLYGRQELLEAMPPYQGGGDMIESVTFEKTTYAGLPNKFEAGTPNIAGAIGLAAAIEFVTAQGFAKFGPYEHELFDYATRRLAEVPGLRIIGTAKNRASVISFIFENPAMSMLDLGMKLDAQGIAVRTGHHCCQPVMNRFGIAATTRASFTLYNTRDDVDALVEALKKIRAEELSTAVASPTNLTPAELSFPPAAGESPQAVADELAEVFEFLDDKNARNQQLLDFAKELPNYFDLLKTLTQRVPGCMSQVYLIARPMPADPRRIEFVADADAHIVRGEIVMLQKLFSGQPAQDILNFNVDTFFHRIGLEQFLSMQRRTGLGSMIARIRSAATAIVG